MIFEKDFSSVGKYDVCESDQYKVALVVDSYDDPQIQDNQYVLNGINYIEPDMDYHWYRQNSNGIWSHKPGSHNVTMLDSNGLLIFDPQECGRIIGDYDYATFVGYFSLEPYSTS